jgi:hypothetical protein
VDRIYVYNNADNRLFSDPWTMTKHKAKGLTDLDRTNVGTKIQYCREPKE